MVRSACVYFVVLFVIGRSIVFTLDVGASLRHVPDKHDIIGVKAIEPVTVDGPPSGVIAALQSNFQQPLAMLLAQIVLIAGAARLLGRLCQAVGQPSVIGEMTAGILLGPSFLGWIHPGAMHFLFPASSMDGLKLFSQVGVILYMFIVGTRVDLNELRSKAHTAIWVSHVSIVLPFFLGSALSLFIYPTMAPPNVPFSAFALFIGIAMSITAFPVLARLVEERNLSGTVVGTMALGCAAVDDVTAWCLLAVVMAIVKADSLGGSFATLLLLLLYSATMIFLLKPFLSRISGRHELSDSGRGKAGVNSLAASVLAFALLAGLITEVIGVHALFGSFLAGAVMPMGRLRSLCRERFESISTGLLLPLFFAYTGLRTDMNLLIHPSIWLVCAAVVAVAVIGKLGGSMMAARWSGMDWRDSFCLGALMNTRGLMELIVLNIGYDLGILSAQIFAVLVLMALVTTFMTAPLLSQYRPKAL